MLSNISPFSVIYLPEKKQFRKFSQPITAVAFYQNHQIDLLKKSRGPGGLEHLEALLATISLSEKDSNPHVFHLTYEFGLNSELKKKLPEDALMGIYILYSSSMPWQLEPRTKRGELGKETLPRKSSYKKKFLKIQKHLNRGDSYQVNLTMPFLLKFKKTPSPEHLLSQFWRKESSRGAYAHASFLPFLNLLFLSNSPECLFEIQSQKIKTMPIKGTIRSDQKHAWKTLRSSIKDQAELYMITDLLRNDLNLISGPEAKVLKKKVRLNVSGLIHQFSLIEKRWTGSLSFADLLKRLFPGGSITGAPKKRTVEIINDTEQLLRKFYTGSTLISHKGLKAGSLNIRSGVVDYSKNELSYNAGGGITLLSDCDQEYDEMLAKWESFKNLL